MAQGEARNRLLELEVFCAADRERPFAGGQSGTRSVPVNRFGTPLFQKSIEEISGCEYYGNVHSLPS